MQQVRIQINIKNQSPKHWKRKRWRTMIFQPDLLDAITDMLRWWVYFAQIYMREYETPFTLETKSVHARASKSTCRVHSQNEEHICKYGKVQCKCTYILFSMLFHIEWTHHRFILQALTWIKSTHFYWSTTNLWSNLLATASQMMLIQSLSTLQVRPSTFEIFQKAYSTTLLTAHRSSVG